MRLDRERAAAAIKRHVADPLRLSATRAAWGIHAVVNDNMARAARVHCLERGKDSRDTIYFRTVFLRGLRAVDVLTQQPEWDGRRVIANGRSQGGAIGLALGGIDPRVTCVVVEIPGMCDHTGILAGRMVAWPRFLPASVNAKQDPKVVEAIRYYDATNFATRIKGPTYVTLGWTDQLCPPTGIYAAYNQLKVPKKILDLKNLAHLRSVEGDKFVRDSIKEYLASTQP